jgi:hypothetical protein
MEVTQKQFARKKPDQLVYLELGSGNGGMLLSISEEGFRFRAVSPLRPNGLMPFAFSFDGTRRLQGIGEVEWLEDDGKSGGMRFVEVSPDFRSELDQWLALDPPRGRSGRETTPAPANPPDTMAKIREELRRGYPQAAPREPAQKEAQGVLPASPIKPRPEQPAEKSGPESLAQRAQPDLDSAEPAVAVNKPEEPAEPKPSHAKVRAPAPPPAERERRSQPLPQQGRPRVERKPPVEPRPQPFYPPPFTQPAESETPGNFNMANSAFLKKPPAAAPPVAPATPPVAPATPPENSATRSAFEDPQQAATVAPAPPSSRGLANESAEALRRPFRQESRSSHSDRPYIPPVDSSFDAAWERAKLNAPPESPRLSRAAAGSIIGVALAVILGAMAFNFRQDIGQFVIDLGQKISGGPSTVAPSLPPVPDTKPGSQTPAEGSAPESSANGPDAANGATASATRPSTSANRPAESHDMNAAATHDTRGSNATRGSTPAGSTGGTANRTAAGAPTGSEESARSVGSGANSASGPEIATEPGGGQEEFNAAREMLRGDHRQRNLSKAVDLLWAGVRKGYVPAEVTLADLYRRGDGVTKNCDQAQVLLVAASKKGSPEARQMLEQMAEEGCSD